jgi:hypothetical protein
VDLTLAPSINDTRGKAILAIVDQRLKGLDLTPILVYRVANLPNSAVLAMAWQWDVLDPSWASGIAAGEAWDPLSAIDPLTNVDQLFSANNDATSVSDLDTYRQLIANSVPLHRQRGTPAGILSALTQIGFPNASILEGQNSWGGTGWPASQGWAVFRVIIQIQPGQIITPLNINQITGAANFWKNARSWLDSVQFSPPAQTDLVNPAPGDMLVNVFAQGDTPNPQPSDSVSAGMATHRYQERRTTA